MSDDQPRTKTDFISRVRTSSPRRKRPVDRQQPIDSFWSDFGSVTFWGHISPFLPLPLVAIAGALFLLGVGPGLLILLVAVAVVFGVIALRDFF